MFGSALVQQTDFLSCRLLLTTVLCVFIQQNPAMRDTNLAPIVVADLASWSLITITHKLTLSELRPGPRRFHSLHQKSTTSFFSVLNINDFHIDTLEHILESQLHFLQRRQSACSD